MNDSYIYNKCCELNWDIVRKFLLDPTINDDKKLRCILYKNEFTCGWTCLHQVCYVGAPADIIKLFIDIGGKQLVMMTTDLAENTALHFACSMGVSFDVMKTLIDVGGKELVMANDKQGKGALYRMCFSTKDTTCVTQKIKLMLQVAGTETILTEKNKKGKTLLDIATTKGSSDEIMALLRPRPPAITNKPENPRRCKQQTFEGRFKQLKDFKSKFGHCNVTQSYSMDPSLGNWCNTMRRYYNQIQKGQKSKGNLTQDQIARLEEIGFKWGKVKFEQRCRDLEAFKSKFGHCNVPCTYSADPSLGQWCNNMRYYYNQIQQGQTPNSNLTQDQIARLEEIGFKCKVI